MDKLMSHKEVKRAQILELLIENVKQRATLSRLGVETASNSFHLSM